MIRLAAFCVVFALGSVSVAQAASTRMFSYDPVSADAKRLTGAGLTVVFKQHMFGTEAVRVMATAVPVKANVKRVGEGQLGRGGLTRLIGAKASEGDLYAIDLSRDQGLVFVQAFCPGSEKLWLAMGELDRNRNLVIHAIGDDPAAKGQTRKCADLEFAYHGEWRLPEQGSLPDPLEVSRLSDQAQGGQ